MVVSIIGALFQQPSWPLNAKTEPTEMWFALWRSPDHRTSQNRLSIGIALAADGLWTRRLNSVTLIHGSTASDTYRTQMAEQSCDFNKELAFILNSGMIGWKTYVHDACRMVANYDRKQTKNRWNFFFTSDDWLLISSLKDSNTQATVTMKNFVY